MMRRRLCPPLIAFCLLVSVHLTAKADTLTVTSTPSGATVEIDDVKVGTTPYKVEVPGGYFHGTRSAFGKRLGHPMVLRISMEGYATKEIGMTEGPMQWIALNGTYHGNYWILKTNHFDITLLPISKSFTGSVVATLAGNTKVEMGAELPTEDIVERSKPAVVLLRRAEGQGTGFMISDTGVIATNAHVARGQESLVAVFTNGESLEAKVVYTDADLDFALVKVQGAGFPHLPLADLSMVREGQTSVAIGNPGQGLPFSVSRGIVSAVGKDPDAGPGTWIQTDTTVNPGNSGGPLLNGHGEVIGMITMKVVRQGFQGIAFALSSTDMLEVLHKFYPSSSMIDAEAAKMPDGTGTVNVSSDPDGAEIYVDEKFIGNTPATLRPPTGTHVIRLKSPGHVDWERTIQILKDSQVSLKASLERRK
jgi:S1-C subfamily serine protease